ncbi:flagellar biosynthesis regulator FlaF, partial [bacterium]|nr:flagellar biosynthesis regulator FlaF [bacterium]
LREKDIMPEEDADTPARRIYFAVQLMYIDPENRPAHIESFFALAHELMDAASTTTPYINSICDQVTLSRFYQALKAARNLIDYEKELITHVEPVLSKAALKLKMCQDRWDSPEREKLLDEAIRYNQKVWSFFQSELSMPDNPLPKNVREDILNMSLFIDNRLFEVMAFPSDPRKLDIVININFNIAAGLRTTPPES